MIRNILLGLCWSLIATVVVTEVMNLRMDIAKHVRCSTTVEPNVIKVTVNTAVLRLITTVMPLNELPDPISGTNAFFKAMSCEAAKWTLNEIYKFVSGSGMFGNSDDEYGDLGKNKVDFKMDFATLATTVHENVSRFTGVLNAVSGRLTTDHDTRIHPRWRRCTRCRSTCIFCSHPWPPI